jgi:DNA-binding response OmpR family regulator
MSQISTPHILVIEDDPGIASGLKKGLEGEGFRVTWKDHRQDGINSTQ